VRHEELVVWWTRRRNDKYETQCKNPETSRCRAYLSTKVLECAQVQSTQKLVNPTNPLSGMPAHPSPAAPWDQSDRPAANSLPKETIKVPRKEDLF
jgi:hypothetical protein